MATCEVDDAHYASSPHSMKCVAGGSDGYCRIPIEFTVEPYYLKFLMDDINSEILIRIQSTNANTSGAVTMVMVRMQTGGDIEYYNGIAWVDTGYNWTADVFHTIKIVMNTTAFTFDMWYGVTQIVTDGEFYNDQTPALSIHYGVESSTGNKTCWYDDIQVGDAEVVFGINPSKHGAMAGGVPI